MLLRRVRVKYEGPVNGLILMAKLGGSSEQTAFGREIVAEKGWSFVPPMSFG